MNKIFFKIIAFLIIIVLNSCHDRIDSNYLVTYNKSKSSIYSIISPSDDMTAGTYYIEFQEGYDSSKDLFGPFIFEEIRPDSKYKNHDTPLYWTFFFKQIKDKKMRLFIVSKDSVDKYEWKTIFKKQIYNKKYKLTLEDLIRQNWEITYE